MTALSLAFHCHTHTMIHTLDSDVCVLRLFALLLSLDFVFSAIGRPLSRVRRLFQTGKKNVVTILLIIKNNLFNSDVLWCEII